MLTNDLIKKIENIIISNMTESKIPGLAVALVKNSEILYKSAFGNRDLTNEISLIKHLMSHSSGIPNLRECLMMSALDIEPKKHPILKTKSIFTRLIGKYATFLNHYQTEVINDNGILFVKMNYHEFRKMNNPLIVKNIENLEFYIYTNGAKTSIKFLIHDNNQIDMLIERNCFHKQ